MAEIWKPQSIEVYKSWTDALEYEALDKLNDWELSFISSITMRLDKGIDLTQSQAEILEKIYTKHTN